MARLVDWLECGGWIQIVVKVREMETKRNNRTSVTLSMSFSRSVQMEWDQM